MGFAAGENDFSFRTDRHFHLQDTTDKTYGYRRVWLWLKRKDIHKNPKTILHGYSLGGAVTSHVAANVAKQNNLKGNIPDSRKLGGVVLQSPIETMYSAAKNLTHSSIAAFFGSKGSGAYNTRENMQRLYQNDPSIPVIYISGTEGSKDHLSLEITNLQADPKAPFQNASVSFTDSAHHEVGDILMSAEEHLHLATDGRNVHLNTNSIQRQGDAPVQEQEERAPMEL